MPLDPVAGFHLSNNAEAWRLNPFADLSTNSRKQPFGLRVNYPYDLARIRAARRCTTGSTGVPPPRLRAPVRRS